MKPADASDLRPVAAASGAAKGAHPEAMQGGRLRQSVPAAAMRVTLF
jgi:hypothetical protein